VRVCATIKKGQPAKRSAGKMHLLAIVASCAAAVSATGTKRRLQFAMDDTTIRTAVWAWLWDASAAEATYGHISTWETGGVTDMSCLFARFECTSSTQGVYYNSGAASFDENISAWDTSGVRTMVMMFTDASAFNQPLGEWNVAKVTDMSWMFSIASSFNQPIGDWRVDMVRKMRSMFYEALVFNQPLGDWQVASVTSMRSMFYGASAFDQDLGWCVGTNVELRNAFVGTQCASTSCGVEQMRQYWLSSCEMRWPSTAPTASPAPTTSAPSPAPTFKPSPVPTTSPAPSLAPTPAPTTSSGTALADTITLIVFILLICAVFGCVVGCVAVPWAVRSLRQVLNLKVI